MKQFYVVRRKKDNILLGLYYRSNQGRDFCNDVEVVFSDDYTPALFDDLPRLKKALQKDTPWYNTSSNSPGWGDTFKDQSEVEIVEVKLQINKQVPV